MMVSSILPPMLHSNFKGVAYDDLFANLSRKVIHQQLSTKVAAVIEARFLDACDGRIDASKVLMLSNEDLAKVGLSKSKQRAINELASIFIDDPDSMHAILSDNDGVVIERITSLYGFGHWSAQMFLLFDLGRRDVWAPLDLGVRKGYQRLKGLEEVPTFGQLKGVSAIYSPIGSMATWYLWRILELPSPS